MKLRTNFISIVTVSSNIKDSLCTETGFSLKSGNVISVISKYNVFHHWHDPAIAQASIYCIKPGIYQLSIENLIMIA